MLRFVASFLLVLPCTLAQVPPWLSADYCNEIRTKGGREVVIKCPVCNGNESTLTIQWYKENQLIDPNEWPRFRTASNGTKLKIAGARVEDSGQYCCTADNGFGKRNVTIKVIIDQVEMSLDSCPQKVLKQLNMSKVVHSLAKLQPKSVEVNVSSRTVLSCWVRSRFRPTVCWLKETTTDEMLPPSVPLIFMDHWQFQVMPSNDTIKRESDEPLVKSMYQKEMTMDPVDEGHGGTYFCLAIDPDGFRLEATRLVVSEPVEGENCDYATVPIWVLLLPTGVFLILAGGLVCWLKTRDSANPVADDSAFSILGIKRKPVEMVPEVSLVTSKITD